ELVGDLVLSCTGGTPTAQGQEIPRFTVALTTNAPITSRVLADPWGEPLLLLDDPAIGAQAPCRSADGVCKNLGNGTGKDYYVGKGGSNVNLFQGQIAGRSVSWTVPLDAPPTNGQRVIRLTNVRVNAASLEAPASGVAQVLATVTLSGPSQIAVT